MSVADGNQKIADTALMGFIRAHSLAMGPALALLFWSVLAVVLYCTV